MAPAKPERGPSGATTTISPKGRKASISTFSPFAFTPSSFDSNNKGRFILKNNLVYNYNKSKDTTISAYNGYKFPKNIKKIATFRRKP
jgi:hypothetical protein